MELTRKSDDQDRKKRFRRILDTFSKPLEIPTTRTVVGTSYTRDDWTIYRLDEKKPVWRKKFTMDLSLDEIPKSTTWSTFMKSEAYKSMVEKEEKRAIMDVSLDLGPAADELRIQQEKKLVCKSHEKLVKRDTRSLPEMIQTDPQLNLLSYDFP